MVKKRYYAPILKSRGLQAQQEDLLCASDPDVVVDPGEDLWDQWESQGK